MSRLRSRSGPVRSLVTVLVLVVVALVFASSAPAQVASGSRRPNVIIILADDLGYGELGCYGQAKIRTPNIDRLAAEGMRFTRHYSGSPVCAPSRCVLLTGKHTGHSFIRDNREVGGWGPEDAEGQWPLADEETTLAEVVRELGYATCAVGKWGLGGPGSTGHPCVQGFDHFYGYLCQRVAHNYYPTHLWRNHDVDVQHGNRYFSAHQRINAPLENEQAYERFRGGDYAPAAIAEEAITFIRDHREGPFLLHYASIIPHLALQAPQPYVERYPRQWDPAPYLGDRGYLPHPRPRACYAAMISFLDDVVGRILDTLDELGIGGRTLILFTSDNGTTYTGGCDRQFFNSLGELRGHKGTLYEGGIRVPLIARWPGRVPAGVVSDHISGFQDVLPTIVELSGGEIPQGLDGISFAPTLLGRAERQREHEHLYWEYSGGGGWQAVILGRYKAVRRNLRKGETHIALYDLRADPGESRDIAADHGEIVERARRIMRQGRRPSKAFPFPALDQAAGRSGE